MMVVASHMKPEPDMTFNKPRQYAILRDVPPPIEAKKYILKQIFHLKINRYRIFNVV
jgi:hypothetical protein